MCMSCMRELAILVWSITIGKCVCIVIYVIIDHCVKTVYPPGLSKPSWSRRFKNGTTNNRSSWPSHTAAKAIGDILHCMNIIDDIISIYLNKHLFETSRYSSLIGTSPKAAVFYFLFAGKGDCLPPVEFGPLLLSWFYINPSVDKKSHAQ